MRTHFIETPIFTQEIVTLLSDEEYRTFQSELMQAPNAWPVIRGSGGIRKARCKSKSKGKGKGKSGGIRIIYYVVSQNNILLLFAYPKNKQENLTSQQLKQLKTLVELL